ncbi:MAG: hypothetical protein A3D94_02780 [Alphaproteobacteria bacterium RIFCSPHIGHO2_12_FULL_66_14]|jgi:hypothetical protein|nr:MAG: hypothetical protein A3D94_02780 [Alphaproteobacteria bacterium RIFCSPHIGHO2_12_FULL_66_14]
MRFTRRITAALSALAALPALALAATIGGTYYAPQYDYREFWAATDNKPFQVVLEGNPFPGTDPATVARDLLPAMQAAKPQPALTFTYNRPSPPPSPDYRLVLVFDPALNLNADPVCAGTDMRFRPSKPGRFYVYAIYCRNDRMLSYTTAWTDATGPADPRIERLFRELFPVVFNDQQTRWAELDVHYF